VAWDAAAALTRVVLVLPPAAAAATTLLSLIPSLFGEYQSTRRLITVEAASTHKSAKTHASSVFVTRSLDLFDPKINWFPGLIVAHFCVTFVDPIAASVFEMSCGETDGHTNKRR